MPFLSRVFGRNKDGAGHSKNKQQQAKPAAPPKEPLPPKPKYDDAWTRRDVSAEAIEELLHVCSQEMKSRALDMPFLLLPFRPNTDTSAARTFIRSLFRPEHGDEPQYRGGRLYHELRLVEPIVLCSIIKWSWARLDGGVVGWDAYELFKTGEKDSNMTKHAFDTFIPLSVESEARKNIVFDFFDLLAAISANGKANGLGGRKLSRLAGWWAFEHADTGKGFEGGYQSWESAANATSHLFFAYLRSLAPDSVAGSSGISKLPRSLQALVSQTEYPPEKPHLLETSTPKVVMIVEQVSPTPYSLLRRAKNFEYRDEDSTLQRFSEFDDPIQALTFECRRVLDCISSINQSAEQNGDSNPPGQGDASWSRFEDMGFTSVLDLEQPKESQPGRGYMSTEQGLRTKPASGAQDMGRPTTPSWADFLSSGFTDDTAQRAPASLRLPPHQMLPPINQPRVHSSQSHYRHGLKDDNLEPGELASISRIDIDETFWWVWMTSLSGEESSMRKAVFGRCALVETDIFEGSWLVMEEQVKGAAAEPAETAYIVEKKSRFTFGKRNRAQKTLKKTPPNAKDPKAKSSPKAASSPALSKPSINAEQKAKVDAAAAELVRQQNDDDGSPGAATRRGRMGDDPDSKTNSVMTLGLQPVLQKEAAPAIQWARKFDKDSIRDRYLGDPMAGTGGSRATSMATTMDLVSAMKAVDTSKSPDETGQDRDPMSSAQNHINQISSSPDNRMLSASATTLRQPSPGRSQEAPNDEKIVSSHRYKESEKTVVSPDVLNQTSQSALEKETLGAQDDSDHPAFRVPSDKTRGSNAQETGPQRQNANPAAAAAAAAMKNQNSSEVSPQPNVQRSKVGSTRKFKSLFSRKREDKAEEPEALAMHRAINGGTLRKQKDRPSGSSGTSHEHPPPPTSAPPPVPESESSSRAGAGPETSFGDIEAGEPGPEVETGTEYEMPDDDRGRSLEQTISANRNSAQFSNFTSGPLEDQPGFAPRDGSVSPVQTLDELSESRPSTSTPNGAAQRPLSGQRQSEPGAPAYSEDFATPMELGRKTADDQEAKGEGQIAQSDPTPSGMSQDRWAQIRRNAAERKTGTEQETFGDHGSRQSQSGQTEHTDRTDEGETSGEESKFLHPSRRL
ncbi:MAG: hypothetical protein M1831_000438 [Alyxoria varia]|nr:MAG: hypothetical protein M1831_000438 [Alyxoria varia]